MVFLHDYYEPTLAILYQSNPTWTGYVLSIEVDVEIEY